jgi:ribokinase
MELQPPYVLVIGSSNTDMVVRSSHLPGPGETVLGGVFAMVPGGKGANQAVAAARLGARVTFIARVGTDVFGDHAIKGLTEAGIDTRFVFRDHDAPSGVALIGVSDGNGENAILVAPGANARLSVADIEAASEAIRAADVLVCQLETPPETVEASLSMAARSGVRTILNPAPAQVLPMSLMQNVSVLTPNQQEAATIAGTDGQDLPQTAHRLRGLGAKSVVITRGSEGAYVASEVSDLDVPSFVASVVDTTAAGDCFTGALAVALAEGMNLERAVRFAAAAASLSVERSGAQPSLPMRADVEQRLIS